MAALDGFSRNVLPRMIIINSSLYVNFLWHSTVHFYSIINNKWMMIDDQETNGSGRRPRPETTVLPL